VPISTKEEYSKVAKIITDDEEMIPLFVKQKDGTIHIIGSFVQELDVKSFQGSQIVYLGKPFDEALLDTQKDSDKKVEEPLEKE
jgi:hypothetical protein